MQLQPRHGTAVACEWSVLHRKDKHPQRGVVNSGGTDDMAVATLAQGNVSRLQRKVVVWILHIHL